MIKKKICMLGSFAVGKTSLVQRFVSSMFEEKYHTTIGVKIDKKVVVLDDREITLLLWDIHGEDEYQKVQASYLLGASGYLIVIDGTRNRTIEVGKSLQQFAEENIGQKPFLVLLNKADLTLEWEVDEETIRSLEASGFKIRKTSAKTGQGVEEAFRELTQLMLTD